VIMKLKKERSNFMKKLDTTKLTVEQIELFNSHLPYMSTVNDNSVPQDSPKSTLKAIDASTIQYREKNKSTAYANLKNGSVAAIVVADVPTHKAFRVLGHAEIHEGDDYAKKIVSGTDTPEAFVVNIKIEEVDA